MEEFHIILYPFPLLGVLIFFISIKIWLSKIFRQFSDQFSFWKTFCAHIFNKYQINSNLYFKKENFIFTENYPDFHFSIQE
jgi:hypothetical protein